MLLVVTGVAGFIGSHLAEALVRQGHSVRGIDVFVDYYPRSLKERNIAWLVQQPRFQMVEADLLDADLRALFDGAQAIFHLAGQPGVRGSWGKNFAAYLKNNTLATQQLLEAALQSGIQKIIYASSSSVYGNIAEMPLHEDMMLAPISPYGVTKLAGEHLCRLYAQVYGMDIVSLRLFTVYGPRQRPEMAFSRFIHATLNQQEIILYGDGEQTRDFTYVDDVIRGFLLALERGKPSHVYNISGGARVSVNDVLHVLGELTGCTPLISYKPAQAGDVLHTWASTEKARRELGYAPTVIIKEGLESQIAFSQYKI